MTVKAPFPYFGGKSRVAPEVWQRFGTVARYVEPFAGSLAVLLARPLPFTGREIVNDSDGLLVNAWRAMTLDPAAVAAWADWPATENDLHARHSWLVGHREDITRRLEGDPDWFDAKAAGWWLWGIGLWIGGGWCSGEGPWRVVDGELVNDGGEGPGVSRRSPAEKGIRPRGIHRKRLPSTGNSPLHGIHAGNDGRGIHRQLLHAGNDGRGIHRQLLHAGTDGQGIHRKLLHAGNDGRGIHRQLLHAGTDGQGIHRKLLHAGDDGRGIHRQLLHAGTDGQGIHRKLLHAGDDGRGDARIVGWQRERLEAVFDEIAGRVRGALIMCGDWSRVVTPAVLFGSGKGRSGTDGACAVFLDPPYADTADRTAGLYAHDSEDVAHAVREWAIANGDDPRLRIALAGYEGEHAMPDSWSVLEWSTKGGYSGQGSGTKAATNRKRERVWFSPHCLRVGLWEVTA